MKVVEVVVFGTDEKGACSCGCGHAHSMREASELLEKRLAEKFGEAVSFRYVDVFSEEIMDFPGVVRIMNQFKLPLTLLNGEPRFHGGLAFEKIAGAVSELLRSR